MAFVRIYTGPDGESHFEELALPFKPADLAPLIGPLSAEVSSPYVDILLEKAKSVMFARQPVGKTLDFHPVRQRHYAVTMAGELEIEVGSGEVRRFGPADLVLYDDVTGRGHILRVVGNEPLIDVSIFLA